MSAPVKVKAVRLVEDGLYILEPTWGQVLQVNGVNCPAGQRSVVSDPNQVKVVRTYPVGVSHYQKKGDPGVTITPEQFATQLAEKIAGREDKDGDIDFESLEQEYEYKKFMASWEAVLLPPKTEHLPIELDVVEVRRESGDPDIVSLWNAPHVAEVRSGLYELKREAADLRAFRERCALHGLVAEVPSHSGLEFAKVGAKYIFDRATYQHPKSPFIGTLEQCKEEKAKRVAAVNAAVDMVAAALSPAPLKGAGAVIEQLSEILSMLRRVEAKADSRAGLNVSRTRLTELIDQLVRVHK